MKNRVIQYTEKQMDHSLDLYTYRVSCTVSGADRMDTVCGYREVELMKCPVGADIWFNCGACIGDVCIACAINPRFSAVLFTTHCT